MDTSKNYSSPTLDFLKGEGINLPEPTDEDYAELLFFVINTLHENGTLANIIGNKPLSWSGNEKLRWALQAEARETRLHPNNVRAQCVIETKAPPYSYVYLACTRNEAYWLLVENDRQDRNDSEDYRFTELDPSMLAEFFSPYRHHGDHIGVQILREIQKMVNELSCEWKAKQQQLDQAATFLSVTADRIDSARTTPGTGDGMEG